MRRRVSVWLPVLALVALAALPVAVEARILVFACQLSGSVLIAVLAHRTSVSGALEASRAASGDAANRAARETKRKAPTRVRPSPSAKPHPLEARATYILVGSTAARSRAPSVPAPPSCPPAKEESNPFRPSATEDACHRLLSEHRLLLSAADQCPSCRGHRDTWRELFQSTDSERSTVRSFTKQ